MHRFWPDGNYAAPTDEALRFDVEAHKVHDCLLMKWPAFFVSS
jgi:hypothetical protein